MNKTLSILAIFLFIACSEGRYPDKYSRLCDAVEQSNKQNKPILIIYSRHGLGYDEFLNDFIGNKNIRNELAENFIVLDLKTDATDKEKDNELQISPLNCLGFQFDSKLSLGELNLEIQKKISGTVNQPHYQILNPKLENIIEGFDYTSRNVSFFKRKLIESKENFEHNITKEKLKEEIIVAEYLGMQCDCPQWKLLKAIKNETEEIQLVPLDTIEIRILNKETPKPFLHNQKQIYEFKGRFYKDEQRIKYEDNSKTITVKTFVYSDVKTLE